MLLVVPVGIFAAGLQNNVTTPKPDMPMQGRGMMACPMNVEGTSVAVTDTPTGVAVAITTSKPEDVAEVRRRAEQMATMHSIDRPSPTMMHGQTLAGTVKYESIEKGARLTLTPKDPSKLTEFRKEVRAHVERMQKGDCTMMQDMMQGMMHGMGARDTTPQPQK
jgi:hypothetical protein